MNRKRISLEIPVYISFRRIINEELKLISKKGKCVKTGNDSECLHEYRVGIRRIRSLLSVAGDIFNREDSRRLSRILALIMDGSGRLRDLDVQISDLKIYSGLIPEGCRRGLELMLEVLCSEREDKASGLCAFLSSCEYRLLIRLVRGKFRGRGMILKGPAGGETTIRSVPRLILDRHEKLLLCADSIEPGSTDEELHRLRIECKKLRYLVSSFLPLFGENDGSNLIQSLKNLQDLLGRYNDYSLQAAIFTSFPADSLTAPGESEEVNRCCGFLLKLVSDLKKQCRPGIESAVAEISGEEARRPFKRFFEVQ